MKRTLAIIIFSVVALLLVGTFGMFVIPAQTKAMTNGKYAPIFALANAIQPNARQNPELKVEALYEPAPKFALPDLKGNLTSLEDFKGKVVMLNFWASWCGPCKEEWGGMQYMAQELGEDPNFVMVAVSVDERDEDVTKFLQENPTSPNLVILRDKGEEVAHEYGSRAWPETYLIDPDGQILHRIIGPRYWDSPAAFSYIRALIESI